MTNLDSILKKQRHYVAKKCPSSQGYGFSSSHVWMWELDCEKSWAPKNWCFWTVVVEKILESPLDCKITPLHPKGNQSSIFIGRTRWSWRSDILATWCEEQTHLKRPWSWERLKMRVEGDNRGWDGCMASLTRWTWVWASSGNWWWDREAWHAAVHGVTKSRTRLSDWTEVKWNLLSCVWLSVTLRTKQSMVVSRAEYWSG